MEDTRGSRQDRSVGELFRDLSAEVSALIRQEAALVRAEMSAKAARAGKQVGFIVAGAAVAYAGLLAVVAAIIIVLARAGMAWWAAALLVGLVVGGIGGFLVYRGIEALKHEDLVPRETLETLREGRNGTRLRDRAAGPG